MPVTNPRALNVGDSPRPITPDYPGDQDEIGLRTNGRRRTFELLSDSLSQTGRKKRNKRTNLLGPYIRAGRWITRGISPFLNLTSVFWIGMAEADTEDVNIEHSYISQYTEEDRKQLARIYNDILDLAPGFRDDMNHLESDLHALNHIIDTMTDAAKGARSDDSGGLKTKVTLYIPLDPRRDACMPPITNEKSKSDHGFNHLMIAHLLCPQKLLQEFDADPSAMCSKFQEGTIKVVADDWPAFLYNEQMYDPQEFDKGLLRGYFLLRVYRHIFMSPSSALKESPGSNSTRSGNAKLHNMTRVTPSTIAYAAVQARFCLSTAEVWSAEDGKFNMEDFHSSIVQLFETDTTDPIDGEWARETLAWWDKSVFGVRAVQSSAASTLHSISDTNAPNDRARLHAQRATRRAQRANPQQLVAGSESM